MPEEAVVEQPLTFTNEEERLKALRELPDRPPPGKDLDTWQAEIDTQEQKILEADVKAVEEESAQKQEPASEQGLQQPPPEEKKEELSGEEKLYFGKYKLEDLPEDLRKYSNVEDPEKAMLEQAGHARRYADKAEKEKYQTGEELAREKREKAALQEKIAQMEKDRDALQKKSDTTPQSRVEERASQADINELTKTIDDLKNISDDDYVPGGTLRKLLAGVADQFSNVKTDLNLALQQAEEAKQTANERVQNLDKQLNKYLKGQEESQRKSNEKTALEETYKGLDKLQVEHSELKLSKAIPDVESSIARFCDKVNGGPCPNWTVANRIINGVLRDDPELTDIMSGRGVVLEENGINKNDIQNYAILLNIDAAMKGEQVDEVTGERKPLLNVLGQKVGFPDHESAYDYLQKRSGILQKKREAELIAAEKRGQQNVESALSQRDTAPKTLGTAGTVTAESAGQELTEVQALEIIGHRRGPNTIDERKMEMAARRGDRRLFKLYNRALKRLEHLGLMQEEPNKDWPTEIAQ